MADRLYPVPTLLNCDPCPLAPLTTNHCRSYPTPLTHPTHAAPYPRGTQAVSNGMAQPQILADDHAREEPKRTSLLSPSHAQHPSTRKRSVLYWRKEEYLILNTGSACIICTSIYLQTCFTYMGSSPGYDQQSVNI